MSRVSRIRHPTGSRFVILYEWIVRAIGRDGAAIIGLLEFLDRAQPEPGQRLASRARIIADLEGIATRQKIDAALALLVELGWVRRHGCKEIRSNIRTWHEYSLAASGISVGTAGVPKWEEPAIAEGNQGEGQNGNQAEFSTYCKHVNQDQEEKQQHEPHKAMDCNAAAPNDFEDQSIHDINGSATSKSEMRRRRGDEIVLAGIEIWTERDREIVLQLIGSHGLSRVEEVAGAIKPALGRSAPLPSAVVAAFQEIADASERSKATDEAIARLDKANKQMLPREEAAARLAVAKAQLSPGRSSS